MQEIGEALGAILGVILVIAAIVAGAIWLWHGIVGTWYLIKYLFHKHPWLNAIIAIAVCLIFGWNLIPIVLLVLICLGPITKAIAKHFWEKELILK